MPSGENLVWPWKSEVVQEARAVIVRVACLARRLAELGDELLDDRIPANETERRGLDHGKGAHRSRIACSGEQRHDAAIRVTDEVSAPRQDLCNVVCVTLEVHPSASQAAAAT